MMERSEKGDRMTLHSTAALALVSMNGVVRRFNFISVGGSSSIWTSAGLCANHLIIMNTTSVTL